MRRLRRASQRCTRTKELFKRGAVIAGAAAVVSLATGTSRAWAAIPVGDRHQVVVAPDADRDLLTDREEVAIGYQPFKADQNRNTFQDGVELAVRCADEIVKLPSAADVNDPTRTYKTEMLQFGLESCEICGEAINMGAVRVVNPRLGMDVELPIIATHYMAHGSFSYAGELHRGRVSVPVLLRALGQRFPGESDAHQLPVGYSGDATDPLVADANDYDGDLMTDVEELAADLNLYDADQNANLTADGIDLARRCAEVIDRLPLFEPGSADAKGTHRINHMLRGLEWCGICGEAVNMGHWEVVNPALGVSIDVPVIAWHFMQHGSFSFTGSVHGAQRADLRALLRVLGLPSRCDDVGMPPLPVDLNGDCRVDFADMAELADRWLDSTVSADNQPERP